eukprot:SAG25_NODE_610_length_6556_cov_22.114500_1_plen_64_part_10
MLQKLISFVGGGLCGINPVLHARCFCLLSDLMAITSDGQLAFAPVCRRSYLQLLVPYISQRVEA